MKLWLLLPRSALVVAGFALILATPACERSHGERTKPAALPLPSVPASREPRVPAGPPPAPPAGPVSELACPAGMAKIPGGEFWVGSAREEHFSPDESPRFLTRMAPFCLDLTEVTASAYAECAARGACEKIERRRVLCNIGRAEHAEHPMNCVRFAQAEAYCKQRGARLPSEVEWEFAARGGAELRKYPWGDAPPDGHACWKHDGTCPVKSYPAGAFGLYDISGNVWEWTSSWYGPYPWPLEHGFAKVYRGGSFSRRFEKWMHTRLRDRARPDDAGSHLGFRCALTLENTECPFGRAEDGGCRRGVLTRECEPGESWNGVRCAPPGAPRCREGRHEKPGFGCVLAEEAAPASRDLEAETKGVARVRSPEFDGDCRRNQRDRPHAFRYAGGSHEGRNLISRRDGCKNRDVGVGWNSSCCP